MPRTLVINDREIADDAGCYVIAEIGHNHQGDLQKAKAMFSAAKDCGVDAVKLQKRDNRALFTQEMFDSAYQSENAYGPTYGTHREALEFGRDEYVELKAHAAELGLTFFATAFDLPSVDFLAGLDMPAFKVASADIVNVPLLRYMAQAGKPIILSTGGATWDDIERAHEALEPTGTPFAFLQCTATYPVEAEEMDLRVIETLRERFPDTVIGLSDHQNGIALAPVAYVLGARILEKHFTLNRAWKGSDQAFSLEPGGLRRMVRDLQRTRAAMGDGVKRVHATERAALFKMQKSLVAAVDLRAGHVLSDEDIAIKSPGGGLPPYRLDELIGRKLSSDVQRDQIISLDILGQSGE